MKRTKVIALLVTAIIGLGFVSAQAAEKKVAPKKQTTCPVMGGKINKALYADVNGNRIYVCCKGCIAKIKAEPSKFIEKMKKDGVDPEKAPKKKMDHSGHSGHQH